MKNTEDNSSAKAKEECKEICVTVKWVNCNIDDKEDDVDDKQDDDNNNNNNNNNKIVSFQIEADLPLRWLMILYCDKIGSDFDTTRFEFNGSRLRGFDIPRHLYINSLDVIYAYSSPCSDGLVHSSSRVQFHDDGDEHSSGLYQASICIRMHKQKDKLVRVIRGTPLLPQLMLGLSNAGLFVGGGGSLCFVRDSTRLTHHHTAAQLDIVNGDVIDAFIFYPNSSPLRIIKSSKLALTPEEDLVDISVECKEYEYERIYFRMKRTTQLSKLMESYCHRFKLQSGADFYYNGRRLDASKTPDEEYLMDGAIIYALPIYHH